MKIEAFSQDMVKAFNPPQDTYLISIGDPNEPMIQLRDGWSDVLRLNFHDIDLLRYLNCKDEEIPSYWIKKEALLKYTWFNYEHAQKIAEFVADESKIIDYLIINCHAGVSRSVGIKIALERFLIGKNNSKEIEYSCFNMWVCSVLTEVLYNQEVFDFKSSKKGIVSFGSILDNSDDV